MSRLNLYTPTEQFNNLSTLTVKKSIFTIDQHPISFQQILRWLQLEGKLPIFLQEVMSRHVIEQELQQRTDLEVDSSKVQEAIVRFRQQNTLEEPQCFQNWLIDQGWNETIFCEQVQFNLKLDQFKVKLAASKLTETFIQHKLLLDQVVLSRIVVKSRELAEELKIQIVEDGLSFEQVAQDYSQADDAVTNGLVGVVSRADVQNWLGADVYQFQLGQVVGPIAHQQNWCLLRVEKILPAELDDSVQDYLQEQIFQQWIRKQIQARSVDLRLSDGEGF